MSDQRAVSLLSQLRASVADERVLEAIAALPRERFVPAEQAQRAYENVALPIGGGQTISQPLVVARMLELLAPQAHERVLDVGTGSGYHAALLARLAGHVWTVERRPELAERARRVLGELGIENVTCVVGDGVEGLPEQAPFEAINVAAGSERAPDALRAQLAPGGRMVIPVGARAQHLVVIERTSDGWRYTRHEAVRFVPLLPGFP